MFMAIQDLRDSFSRIRAPGYAFLAATLVFQLFDIFIGLLPLQPRQAVWRFTVIVNGSLLIGNVLLLMLLLHGMMLLFGDTKGVGLMGVLYSLAAAILLVTAASFVLDVVQLRGSVGPDATIRFGMAAGEALGKIIIQSVILIMFARSAFGTWRSATAEAARLAARDARNTEEKMLVSRSLGQSGTAQ